MRVFTIRIVHLRNKYTSNTAMYLCSETTLDMEASEPFFFRLSL